MKDRCRHTKKTSQGYYEHQWRTHAPLIMLLVRGLPLRFELPDGSEFSGKLYVAMRGSKPLIRIVGRRNVIEQFELENKSDIVFDLDDSLGEPPALEGDEID